MTLRIATVLAVAMGVITFAAYLHLVGKAPWTAPAERHLRRMKDRATATATAAPVTFAGFAALPRRASLEVRSAFERRGVTVEGYVQRILRAVDGDLHLDLAPRPSSEDEALPYIVAEVTPAFRKRLRTWSYDGLVERLRPPRGGVTPWEGGPRRVRLTGWLLYDQPHEVRPVRPRYADALAAWEVHPVSRIEVWDPAAGRFEDLR